MARKLKTNPTDEVLKKTLERFDESWDYATTYYHLLWERCWKLYRGRRVKRAHPGIIKTFVPMSFSLVETLTAALFGASPKVEFVPNFPYQENNTESISALLDWNWDKDQWDKKLTSNGKQTFITGNGPVMLTWDVDHVRLEPIAIRDFIMDPCSTGPDNWRYAGRRYLITKQELAACKIVNPETGELEPRYKNLELIEGQFSDGGDKQTDKQRKEALLGTSLAGTNTKQIEIIEIWDRDRAVSVANRGVVIEDIENPTKTQAKFNYELKLAMVADIDPENDPIDYGDIEGVIPFAIQRDYIDASLPYAQGEIEPIIDLQEYLNDLKEMYGEAILYTIHPDGTLDPKYANWLDRMDRVPGKVYPFAAGAFQWNSPPVIPNHAPNEIATVKSEIRETTAIDQVVKGVSGNISQTATEIKAQMGQASQRIQIKARALENDFFPQIARIWFHLFRLYGKPQIVRVMRDTGAEFVEFDPNQFLGEYTPFVQLDVTKEAEKAKQQQAYLQAFQMLVQDPTNNLDEAKKRILPKALPDLSAEDIEAIITPKQPEMPQGQMPMAGQPMPSPQELAMLQGTGIPPQGQIPPEILAQLQAGGMQ